MVKAAHKIWAEFKEKTRDHIAPHFQMTGLPVQVGSKIFLISWDKMLLLATEIVDTIDLEKNEKTDVGAFTFGKTKMELFCTAAYMFMFRDRSGV